MRRRSQRIARLGRTKFCFACDRWAWLQHRHKVRPFEALLTDEWRRR